MRAITKLLGAGAAAAALACAAPAAAQYYPGYGYQGYSQGYAYQGYANPQGYQGYGNDYGYGYNRQGRSEVAANQCSVAVQQRLGGYAGYGGYGRGLRITSIEIRQGGGYRVRGLAVVGGYGYGGGQVPFSCRTDPRGFVVDVDLNGRGNGRDVDPYHSYGPYGYTRY